MAAAARRLDPARHILVVEDEDPVCDVISDILEEAGFRPHCVGSDRSAYAALSTAVGFVALVVDINLGAGTTGYDVARFARQARPDLPVLYVSGQSPPSSFAAFGVPQSVFLQKPFTPDELVRTLEQLLAEG